MTREKACIKAQDIDFHGGFTIALVTEIYDDFERQLSNLKYNYEAQEIMIADYKKRIVELEAPKTCETCKHYDRSHQCNNSSSIAWETSNRVYPDDYCKDYEPKDK